MKVGEQLIKVNPIQGLVEKKCLKSLGNNYLKSNELDWLEWSWNDKTLFFSFIFVGTYMFLYWPIQGRITDKVASTTSTWAAATIGACKGVQILPRQSANTPPGIRIMSKFRYRRKLNLKKYFRSFYLNYRQKYFTLGEGKVFGQEEEEWGQDKWRDRFLLVSEGVEMEVEQ